MTNTKFLEKINAIINITYVDTDAKRALEALRDEIISDIYNEEAKKAGNGNRRKAIEKYIKNTNREDYKGVFEIDGAQYMTNGFSCIKLYKPFEYLPEAVEKFEAGKIAIEKAAKNELPLELPDIATLKARKKELKATQGKKATIKYDFGENMPIVDIDLLLEVYNILGTENLVAYSSEKNYLNPIYFENENGKAVLMPMYKKQS